MLQLSGNKLERGEVRELQLVVGGCRLDDLAQEEVLVDPRVGDRDVERRPPSVMSRHRWHGGPLVRRAQPLRGAGALDWPVLELRGPVLLDGLEERAAPGPLDAA